jgi:hypothetical protein
VVPSSLWKDGGVGKVGEAKSMFKFVLKAGILEASIALAFAGFVLGVCVDPAAAMPVWSRVTKSSPAADRPIAVSWRGHVHGVSHGERERALIAREIVGGPVPNPGLLYGRYLGYYGYPGRYPCCYYPQSFDRVYYPYYYAFRTVQANPTWWDYPAHWEGW